MMETKHTPGPWQVTDRDNCGDNIWTVSEPRRRIANTYGSSEFSTNAQLIAAAPEMLEALQQLADHVQHDLGVYTDSPYLQRARDVISKAINGAVNIPVDRFRVVSG